MSFECWFWLFFGTVGAVALFLALFYNYMGTRPVGGKE